MEEKELPKSIKEDIRCKDCVYYERPGWKPWWSERYCHHPKVFRTGLIDTTFGCERWEKNMEEKEKDFIIYFETCLEKDYLVLEKRLTLRYMQEALDEIEQLRSENNRLKDFQTKYLGLCK